MDPGAIDSRASERIPIIVVEDSEDDYRLLLARFKAIGVAVEARRVETEPALREALGEGPCGAVIADHRLPQLSSLEALRIVRAFDPDMPFLIVSGAIGEEVAVEAIRAGADDYLMKDRLIRLESAFRRALAAASARRRQRDAERAAAESEARFRSLSANLPGMVFQIECRGPSRSLVYASEGSRRLFGVAPDALLGDPNGWFALFTDASRLDRLFAASIPPRDGSESDAQGAADRHWLEHTAELASAPHGRKRWIEFTARARRLAADHLVWDGIAADITPQREAEAALRESREELRELASYLARVREEERAAIARELHDDVGSTLTGIRFQLSFLKSRLAHDPAAAAKLHHFEELVEGVIHSTSRLMHDLRPGILDEGIVPALEWQARTFEHRASVTCTFETSHEDIALTPEASIAVFRICQEALNNVAKHAGATAAHVRIAASPEDLTLEIRDDGIGLPDLPVDERGHFGLRGMRERAHALGGTIVVAGSADEGTTVTLTLPLDGAIARTDALTGVAS